jgi:protein TonB
VIRLTPAHLRWTLAGSALLQVSAITFVPFLARTLAPLEPLDGVALRLRLAPALPPPPPPPAAASAKAVRKPALRRELRVNLAPIPRRAPQWAIFEAPPALETEGMIGGIEGGVPGGVMPVWLGSALSSAAVVPMPPPPPPPPPASAAPPPTPPAPERIRVSSEIQQTMLVSSVRPEYPPLARQARIQGIVRLEAIIARDGAVTQLQVIDGHPLLAPAALAAVAQWRYRPATINGQAVEVITHVHVHFRLE